MDKKSLIAPSELTIWQLIKLFWNGDQRFWAYIFLVVVMGLTIFLVGLDVAFNYWYNYFYDALQAYDKHKTIKLLGIFFAIAGVYIVVAVYRFYLSQLFALRWRRWLTNQFLTRWLSKRSYYLLENFDNKTDNPDQRIQEDVNALAAASIELSLGIVSAITTFFAFIFILWSLSGIFTLSLGSWGVLRIPGYLVWVGLLYALIGTLLTFKIGRPLVNLNFEQQRREATFRYAAIDLRSHAENVALYRGEHHQRTILDKLFGGVLENWYAIILRQKLLLWFTSGYNQLSVLLPLLVALPNYFDKVFLLGGLIQSLQAFGRVQDALSFLVNSYPRIAEWKAVARRLITFANHIVDIENKAEEENKVTFSKHLDNTIVVKNMEISSPDNNLAHKKLLLKNINQEFKHGQGYLIKGESGIGKSTFVRTLAGIWPYAAGSVTLPEKQKIMYLPQKSYMPIGTLAEAILFPDHEDPTLEKQLPELLKACHLEYLIPRLKETAAWSQQLSPGEQQRIAFGRVLLHKPDWVFLDESTSMLDLNNERSLYQLLRERLPQCTIVSVGHRPSLDVYHDVVVDMEAYVPT